MKILIFVKITKVPELSIKLKLKLRFTQLKFKTLFQYNTRIISTKTTYSSNFGYHKYFSGFYFSDSPKEFVKCTADVFTINSTRVQTHSKSFHLLHKNGLNLTSKTDNFHKCETKSDYINSGLSENPQIHTVNIWTET